MVLAFRASKSSSVEISHDLNWGSLEMFIIEFFIMKIQSCWLSNCQITIQGTTEMKVCQNFLRWKKTFYIFFLVLECLCLNLKWLWLGTTRQMGSSYYLRGSHQHFCLTCPSLVSHSKLFLEEKPLVAYEHKYQRQNIQDWRFCKAVVHICQM